MAFARTLLLCLCLICTALPARANQEAPAKILTIAADRWCPINCDPGPRPGLGVEIAQRIFEPLGYEVRYMVMPWARALSLVRAGDIDAVIGANRNDDPTLVFPAMPLARMTDDFYVAKESPFVYDGLHSLKNRRLGIIADYGYSDGVEKVIETARRTPGMVQAVRGERALEQNIRKLLAGRIDVLIESHMVVEEKLHRMGLDDRLRIAGSMPQGDTYLAFSPNRANSRAQADSFDQGMRRLMQEGALEALYADYGVTP